MHTSRIIVFILFCFFGIYQNAFGQSSIKSQANYQLLIDNPAFTGVMDFPEVRLSIYDNNPFEDFGFNRRNAIVSYEQGLNLKNNNTVGLGIIGSYDIGSSLFKNPYIGINAAYHHNLDNSDSGIKQIISIGGNANFIRQTPDVGDLIFPSQIGPNGFDPTLPTGEPAIDDGPHNYATINTGIGYSRIENKDNYIHVGLSVYNITTPTIPALLSEDGYTTINYIGIQTQSSFTLGEKTYVKPLFRFTRSSDSNTFELGSNFAFETNKSGTNRFQFGLGTFDGNVFNISAGMQLKNLDINLGYLFLKNTDFSFSRTYNYELSMGYKFGAYPSTL